MIDVFCGHGEVNIADIRSRLRLMIGNGDIRVDGYQGILFLSSGHSNIVLKHFVQAEMPQSPLSSGPAPETRNKSPWDWLHWDETEWEAWGENLGERIGWCAADIGRLFASGNIAENDLGVRLQTGNGNLDLGDIEAKAAVFKTARGNMKLEDARLGDLEANLSKGNIECKSTVPSGNWSVKTMNGNIRFSLPENISARLDMATRNGSIHSQIPMVRVTRQGPESSSGTRMVGVIGPNPERELPGLHLVTIHGNIDIESGAPVPEYSAKPAESACGPSGLDVASQSQVDRAPLSILEALQEGKISPSEAEELLRSLTL